MKLSRIITVIAVIAVSAVLVAAQSQARKPELKTVPSVDLQKYAGKWYEIARYPNRFQKQCVGNTMATYNLKPNGRVEVINECLKKDGTMDRAKGDARIVDKTTNAKLEVRFAPAFLSFIPVVWGDYWVIDLEKDYKYAAVGDPSRKYLWILSRTPAMDEPVYQALLRRLEAQGFDPGKLEKTTQNLETGKGTVLPK